MKLYRIILKELQGSKVSTAYGRPYVVANDSTEALQKVQSYLKERNLGFPRDRVMDTIELLAEEGDYPGCGIQLYL